MSPGAAPPLPSQLKVHFLYCSTNLWLIVAFLSLSDPVYPCCCIVCDLPTELSRSNHCLTLTSSGWDTLQKLQNYVRLTVSSSSDQLSSQQLSRQTPWSIKYSRPSLQALFWRYPFVGLKSIQSNNTF